MQECKKALSCSVNTLEIYGINMRKFSGSITTYMCDDILTILKGLPVFKESPAFEHIHFELIQGAEGGAWAWSWKSDVKEWTIEIDVDRNDTLKRLIGTIAHELIHVMLDNYEDEDQHGPKFQKVLKQVTTQLGMEVA